MSCSLHNTNLNVFVTAFLDLQDIADRSNSRVKVCLEMAVSASRPKANAIRRLSEYGVVLGRGKKVRFHVR